MPAELHTIKSDKGAITFEGPDVWLRSHWMVYAQARSEFFDKQREAKAFADTLTADFLGAKALIDKGIVRIRNADALVDLIRETKTDQLELELNVMNLVGDAVKTLVNTVAASPLDRYLNKPLSTSTPPASTTDVAVTDRNRSHPRS